MDARIISTPFRRILVARPRHHALGLLVADVLICLHVARASGTPMLLLRGDRGEDSPLLHLIAKGVLRVDNLPLRTPLASRVWTLLLGWFRFQHFLKFLRNYVIDGMLVVTDLVTNLVARIVGLPGTFRKFTNIQVRNAQTRLDGGPNSKLKRRSRWRQIAVSALDGLKMAKFGRGADPRERVLAARIRMCARLEATRRPTPPGREVHHGYDVRQLSVERPVSVTFSAADEARARAQAEALGLTGVPLVTLHVREGGSKRDASTGGFTRDVARDARTESYLPAVDELVRRGFTVVRIGDPAMTPVKRLGLVDLATHPSRSALVDFWCVKNSRFFMASDSGPYLLSWLFNVPCLALNITNVLGVFPLRRTDVYVIKRVRDTATGRAVPLSEMLTEEFLVTLRRRMNKEGALQYVDNDEDDIRDAVLEMLAGLEQPRAETPLQAEYRRRIAQVRTGPLVRAKLHEKAGADEVFLGQGRVSGAFVDRYFDAVTEQRVTGAR